MIVEIRQSTPADFGALFPLFETNELFLEESPTSAKEFEFYCQWMFERSDNEPRYQLVAEMQSKPVGHYGVINMPYRYQGEPICGGLLSNVVVDKEVRTGGVFLRLQRRLFSEYAKHGFDFLYCTATRKPIIELYSKTGYRAVGKLPVYVRPGLFFSNPFRARDVVVEGFTEFDFELESLAKRALGQYVLQADRSRQFLNWRFNSYDSRGYVCFRAKGATNNEALGYVVTRKMKMKGFQCLAIVDIVYAPDRADVGKALLRRVYQHGRNEKVSLVTTLFNPHMHLAKLFRRSGFLKTPQSFTVLVHEPGPDEPKINEDSFKGWYLTWFDHDYV